MVAPASAHNHLDCALLHCRCCLQKTRESQVFVPDAPRTTQLYYDTEDLRPHVAARRYHSLRVSPALHPPGRPTPLAASLIGHASQHALPRRRGERRHDTHLVYGDSSMSIGTYILLSRTCCHCYSSCLVPVPGKYWYIQRSLHQGENREAIPPRYPCLDKWSTSQLHNCTAVPGSSLVFVSSI